MWLLLPKMYDIKLSRDVGGELELRHALYTKATDI